MKTSLKVFASLLTLLAACALHAADSKPVARVLAIMDIETEDPVGYATWIADYNRIAKPKTGADHYIRVYQTVFDGERTSRVRIAVAASTVAELTKHTAALANDPGIVQNREHLRGIRKLGARILYQTLRYDGVQPVGAANYTTLANVTDEPGYLRALDQLRAIFDANGLKDVKIGAYRVLAGRSDHTHRIVIATPSQERLAAFLDLAGTNPQLQEWLAASAKLRTVVATSTTHEITK